MRNYYITISFEAGSKPVKLPEIPPEQKTEQQKNEQPFNGHTLVTSAVVLSAFIVFMQCFHSL